jgi:hypothetical protein
MIKHHAFFEALGSLQEKTPAWNSVFAGLSVLRLVDRLADVRESNRPLDLHELDASQRAVETIIEGDPSRAILLRVLENVRKGTSDFDLGSNLLSYGRALDLDARWTMACDVFQTIADEFSARTHPQLVIEALAALGAAARNVGDWVASERAYARAEHLADSIGDRAASLTVQIGLASSDMFRGNLQTADAALEKIWAEASTLKLQNIEAIALHARASVSHLKGDYQRTIHLAYRSLELTTNATARDRLVSDIAVAYGELGMKEAARNGYLIVAITSPHQWVRWQATVNLMELAVKEGDKKSFDDYVGRLQDAPLDPRLKTYFLFYRAIGSRRFGRSDAQDLFEQARQHAEENKLHQVAFEIEAAVTREPAKQPFEATLELTRIAEVLEHLRDEVLPNAKSAH